MSNKKSNDKNKEIQYVTLPYDFIPLPDEYYYPYDKESKFPPLHSEVKLNSGYIKYSLMPSTDISVELREGYKEGNPFISGSCMRGKVRANLEILSKSYPEFINTTPMLYRAVADSKELGKFYKIRLCNQENNSKEQVDIESKINVGFLRKDVNDFYVVPAEKYSKEKNFVSIKEHRLYEMGMKMEDYHLLYKEKKNPNIYYKSNNKNNDFEPYQKSIFYPQNNNDGITYISVDQTQNCTEKGYIYNSTNASSKKSHYIVSKPKDDKERFFVSPEIINIYNQNHKKFRVTFDVVEGKTKEECEKQKQKQKEEKIKTFYNIFTDYDKLVNDNSDTSEGLIVFFQFSREKKDEISMIGRTPYFKIPYEHSLREITGEKDEKNIDYADAIFGFISNEDKSAYKSRVRFSAIDINESIKKDEREFLLTTPSATACAMYLEQKGKRLSTYEDVNPPKLNGYKYYRILKDAQTDTIPDDPSKVEKMISNKEVIKAKDSHYKHGYALEGKIYFNNLNENELGLLLLSLDIGKLSATSEYKGKLEEAEIDVSDTYEQIGGAKPYGYGAVEVKIDEMYIEELDSFFETLIGDNVHKLDTSDKLTYTSYIDGFLTEMLDNCKESDYFEYLRPYIGSRQMKTYKEDYITWANIGSKIGQNGGGYPTNWRLKTINTKI